MGFNPGILCVLEGLVQFGLLIRKVALQGLALLDGVLELLLDFTDPSLVLLIGSLLLGRFFLGLGPRLLEGFHLDRRS